MTSWSDLHYDVLEHITEFLPLADHHRFSAICHNWRWVVKHKHCSPAAQLPWLVMQQEASGMIRKLFNLSEKREYYIDIPELYDQRCCGSSFGWLCIIDDKFKARLLNPFTREVYELPELPEMDEKRYLKRDGIIKVVLSDDPSVKLDFTVLFLYSTSMRTVYWRPGDIAWTYVSCMSEETIQDAVFVQGTLYVCYMGGAIHIIELGPNPTTRLVGPMGPPYWGSNYLVDFMGELLFVRRNLKKVGTERFITKKLNLLKVDLQEKKYYPCTNLGDYAIFLGASSPLVMDSRKFQGCKRNSIYFTDIIFERSSREYRYDGLGVYDMRKGTIEPYYPPEIFQPINDPPIWLTPNCRKSVFQSNNTDEAKGPHYL